MSAFSDSYVLNVLLAQRTDGRGEAARRPRWPRPSLFDPYRPELRYMRGPGPRSAFRQSRLRARTSASDSAARAG